MYQPLPEFPPLYPPGDWWRLFLKFRLEDMPEGEAISRANRKCSLKPRSWMRIDITDNSTLSLSVKGGASALKNRAPTTWTLAAEAPRDGRKILSTLATIYGNRPFFHTIAPELSDVFHATESASAAALCMEAFRKASRILSIDDSALLADLKKRIEAGNNLLRQTGMEFKNRFRGELSIIDALFSLGPDAIFTLIPAF